MECKLYGKCLPFFDAVRMMIRLIYKLSKQNGWEDCDQGNLLRGTDNCSGAVWILICGTSSLEGGGQQFHQQFSLFQLKGIKEVTKKVAYYLKKITKKKKKLQFQTILFPYEPCVTEKRIYVNKLKSLTVLLSIFLNKSPWLRSSVWRSWKRKMPYEKTLLQWPTYVRNICFFRCISQNQETKYQIFVVATMHSLFKLRQKIKTKIFRIWFFFLSHRLMQRKKQ